MGAMKNTALTSHGNLFTYKKKPPRENARALLYAFNNMVRAFGRSNAPGSRRGYGSNKGLRGISRYTNPQRCIVKSSVSYSHVASSKHLKYILREGVGKDGNNPELFGAATIDQCTPGKGVKQYRFIISPENVEADLEGLTKILARKIEAHVGSPIVWCAAAHYNTAHPHVHLTVLGTDAAGMPLDISRKLMRYGLRAYAGDILTVMLGERQLELKTKSREASKSRKRTTELDQMIVKLQAGSLIAHTDVTRLGEPTAEEIRSRLKYLVSIRLAYPAQNGYLLNLNWQGSLKASSMYESYMLGLASLRYCHPLSYRPYSSDIGPIAGVVSYVGRLSEMSDHGSVVVLETDNGAYYCRLRKAVPTIKAGEAINIGQKVDDDSKREIMSISVLPKAEAALIKKRLSDDRLRFGSGRS